MSILKGFRGQIQSKSIIIFPLTSIQVYCIGFSEQWDLARAGFFITDYCHFDLELGP